MATAAASTKETTNYARLCRLLVDIGTQALRDKFNGIHSPANLQAVLATNKPMLQTLRARKIINPTQWGKLFPVIPSSVSSASFDITLLMVLFRNICGLVAPVLGWDALPPSTDISPEADIARVKYYRNTVFAHVERASVEDATFNKYWSEIRDTLVRLGGVAYKAAVDNLETDCMDPGIEEHYKELLRQWKNDEDNIKDKLNEMDSAIKNLPKQIADLVEAAVTSRTETSYEGKIFNPDMLVDTSLVCREKHHESELLTSFCEQCKVCICDKCGKTRHSHHTKVDIHQAAKECKVNIEEIAEEMKKQVADFQMQVEKSKESTRKSREEIAAARNKALTSLEELIQQLKKHETTTMTNLDLQEETELRGHATQLEHFQTSINKLQTSVEYCEAILQRNESIEILQVHQPLVERYRGLLNVEKLNFKKPTHTALHTRYEINDELVKTLRCAVPGRLVVCNTDHLQSVAEGKGLKEAYVGNEAEVVITTKDSNQKQCYDEDDQIIVKVQRPSGVELNHKISHRQDGEHSVTYKPDCVGQHNVVVEVNGQPLTGSPWILHVSPHHYRLLFSFGSYGKAQGQFDYPCDVAIDENTGNIAVADCVNNTIQIFSSEGKHLNTISGKEIIHPDSVAFTRSSDLIVIASNKIFCFNESGKVGKNITHKHLKKPFHLTIARDGRMVVCDWGDKTVKVLSPDGTQLLLTISDPDHATPCSAEFHRDMFVACYHLKNNVKVFSKDGVFLHSIGTFGFGDGQLCNPTCLSVDSFSNLVVCDFENRRLQIFTLDCKLVSKIEGEHTGLERPRSVAVSPTGQLYITDTRKHCINVFH